MNLHFIGNIYVQYMQHINPTGNSCCRSKNRDIPVINANIAALDAAIPSYIPKPCLSPSDTILHDNSAEATTAAAAYEKVKEIINPLSGLARIKFAAQVLPGGNDAYIKIYINDIAVGTERLEQDGFYGTWSEDLPIADGDLIQLYAYTTGAPVCWVKDFQICGVLAFYGADNDP